MQFFRLKKKQPYQSSVGGEEWAAAAASLFTFCGRQRPFAGLDEIRAENSPSSDKSAVLNSRPLVELTARGENAHTHLHTKDVRLVVSYYR